MSQNESPFCGCLFYSANVLARNLGRLAEEEFSVVGVAPSYAFLLMAVIGNPGINPSLIGKKMQLSPSTVTRLIEKMEHRGFLERKVAGKFTKVYPTDMGSSLDLKLRKAWSNLHHRYANLLGEEMANSLTTTVYQAAISLE